MKKIGLVTYFKAYNYGVWLQAYATQEFLKKYKYEVEIIDYVNEFENAKLKFMYKQGNRMTGYVSSALKSLLFGKVRYYKKGFKCHIKEFYNLSKESYKNVQELKNVHYDILAVGSDQVWNPVISNGLDDVFLLNFGSADKKISISSSLGSKKLSINDEKKLVKALEKFDAISVREEFAKELLFDKIKKEVKVLVDPTFLLSREDWINKLAKTSKFYDIKTKYILTYFVSKDKNNEECIHTVKSYSEKFELPVWAVQFSSFFSKGVDKKILGASIADFLALILNAELIITDSFHGTALSINLNKNFISCVNSENPVRTLNLLKRLRIPDRINMKVEEFQEVNYDEVNNIIEKMREESMKWLLDAIEKD